MKLTPALVERTLGQFEAHCIPEDHPAVPQLKGIYGDHTFFLDDNGLSIVEPVESTEMETQTGQVVNIANWGDEKQRTLVPHRPEVTDLVIVLGARH